ncbi:hypothetical protein D3C78_1148380 [compost metagenome]
MQQKLQRPQLPEQHRVVVRHFDKLARLETALGLSHYAAPARGEEQRRLTPFMAIAHERVEHLETLGIGAYLAMLLIPLANQAHGLVELLLCRTLRGR